MQIVVAIKIIEGKSNFSICTNNKEGEISILDSHLDIKG